jgi:DNA-directed RNA polymerase sigma subunit (sigma70/sigma32)
MIKDIRVLRAVIREYIAKLSLEERLVLTRRYGIYGKEPMSVEEVAKSLYMSPKDVEKIEARGLRRLRE